MNWQELLWKDDAKAFIEMLAEACGVKAPNLPFTGRTNRRGFYRPRTKAIVVSKWSKVWILTHEFAHYLDHIQNGRAAGRFANDREWHSQGFYYKLRKLTLLLGPGYPWQGEYRQIARWASKDEKVRI